jgi:hypothetical protein
LKKKWRSPTNKRPPRPARFSLRRSNLSKFPN